MRDRPPRGPATRRPHVAFDLGGTRMYLCHGWGLVWTLLLSIAFLLVLRWLPPAGRNAEAADGESPELILKRHYASGAINHEEYERRLADLRK